MKRYMLGIMLITAVCVEAAYFNNYDESKNQSQLRTLWTEFKKAQQVNNLNRLREIYREAQNFKSMQFEAEKNELLNQIEHAIRNVEQAQSKPNQTSKKENKPYY